MSRRDDINTLPEGLPIPEDDGACDHLTGLHLPSISLPETDGQSIDLSAINGRSVVYIYPKTLKASRRLSGWPFIFTYNNCLYLLRRLY